MVYYAMEMIVISMLYNYRIYVKLVGMEDYFENYSKIKEEEYSDTIHNWINLKNT